MTVIVDLTRAIEGTEQDVLDRFLASRVQSPADTVECFLLPSQPDVFAVGDVTLTRVPAEASTNDPLIAAYLHAQISQALEQGGLVHVASFRGSVKAVVESLMERHPDRLEFVRLAAFAPTLPAQRLEWDSSFMPIEEAAQVLTTAIARAKVRVRMTDIRQVLSAHDSRFRKVTGTITARPRFIGDLVQQARNRGLVRLREDIPGSPSNPFIEVTAKGRTISGVAAAPPKPSTMHETAPPAPDKPRSVSDIYIDILRQRDLGPFQEVRWAVYEEIDKIMGEKPWTAYTLIRDAVAGVRDGRAEDLVRTTKPFPWAKVRAFIGALVSRVPVFLKDGTPVYYSWTQISRPIDGLIEDWKLALDGELVCIILRGGADVSLDDMAPLAGALYNSRRDEFQDRAISVVNYLISTGRVAESPSAPTRVQLVGEHGDGS